MLETGLHLAEVTSFSATQAFTPEDTYKMIRKAYGEKVAAPYKPAPKPRTGLFSRASTEVEKDVSRPCKEGKAHLAAGPIISFPSPIGSGWPTPGAALLGLVLPLRGPVGVFRSGRSERRLCLTRR